MKTVVLVFAVILHSNLNAQIKGCTDFRANNYNPDAVENDGSCTYDKTSYSPITICGHLSDTILESSGLIFFDGEFWTINDSDNPPYIYCFDSISGIIKHQTYIADELNIDWEDLTQDSLYIYIGDFGNNNGDRSNLRILKLKKSQINTSVFSDTIQADIIRFKMNDQINFSFSPQAHDYDIEALCVLGDSLHIFSKNWADKKSRHYVCPNDSGFYNLEPLETLEVDGQITGACVSRKGEVILCGYNKGNLGSFMFLFWDYRSHRFNSGNRRRIEIGNLISPGQNEAVSMRGNALYMSNEKQISNAALHRLEIEEWLKPGWGVGIDNFKSNSAEVNIYFYEDRLWIENIGTLIGQSIVFYDSSGRMVYRHQLTGKKESVQTENWAKGLYMVYAGSNLLSRIYVR